MWMISKQKEFYVTTLKDIINEWSQGYKCLRYYYSEKMYIEILLYNSTTFTQENKSLYGCVIHDRFLIQFSKNNMKSDSFEIVWNREKLFKKINKGKFKLKNWIEQEEIINIMKKIENYVDDTEVYLINDMIFN